MILRKLYRNEANELCSKFGSDVFMAGEINSKEDFDVYYQVSANITKLTKITTKTMLVTIMLVTIAKAGDDFDKQAVDNFLPRGFGWFSMVHVCFICWLW